MSIRTRPRRRPVFFCWSSAAASWSLVTSFWPTNTSPSLIFSGRPIATPFNRYLPLFCRCSARASNGFHPRKLGANDLVSRSEFDGVSCPLMQCFGIRRRVQEETELPVQRHSCKKGSGVSGICRKCSCVIPIGQACGGRIEKQRSIVGPEDGGEPMVI